MARRVVVREVIDDGGNLGYGPGPSFFNPVAIILAVIAIVVLLFLLVGQPFSHGSGSSGTSRHTVVRQAPSSNGSGGK